MKHAYRHLAASLAAPILALLVGLLATACSEDETITANTSAVSQAESFTDSRDGHVYRVIRVGNQEWLAENLAYFLPHGAAAGCITWDEKQDITEEELQVDTTDIVVVVDDETYKTIFYNIVNSPDHDWETEVGTPVWRFNLDFKSFYGGDMLSQEDFTAAYVNDKKMEPFSSLLVAALDSARTAQRRTYIDNLLAEKAQIPISHRDKAEAANGGYIATYGYLYTRDGALAAVPKEGGWRLPSDADWKTFETTIGMPTSEVNRNEAWRAAPLGDAIKEGGAIGFNALMGGCNAYQRTQEQLFIRKEDSGYFWASDLGFYTTRETADEETAAADSTVDEDGKVTVTYATGIIRQVATYSSAIWRGTTRLENGYRGMAYSVRLVRDVK